MNTQPLQHPFTDYRGNTWKQAAVDAYNRFNEEVAKRERQARPEPGTLAFKELEFYKDQRHKTFVQLADIAAERGQ